jgi:hypothetical protein
MTATSILRAFRRTAEKYLMESQVLFWRGFVSAFRLRARLARRDAVAVKRRGGTDGLTGSEEAASEKELLEFWRRLHAAKRLYGHFPWLSVSEARRIPILDCKGFAVLLAGYAQRLGFEPQIMVGISAADRVGHAYVNISLHDGVRSFSAGDYLPVNERELAEHYRFAAVYTYRPGA